MDKIAFVFAGQGSQYPGMGKELYDCSPAARKLFELADSLRPGTSAQCFSGTREELAITANTQPCVFTVDLAAAFALREAGLRPWCVAGFSLGELPALTFAGAFSYENAFKTVCKRAELMHASALESPGEMAAILGISSETVESLCGEMNRIYAVNFNCPGQTVVAGSAESLEELMNKVKHRLGGKAIKLAVSGAFHSPFMFVASGQLYDSLAAIDTGELQIPVYANATAQPYGTNIRATLALQVKSPVKWQQTIENMAADGVETFIEVGPGKTLSGLIKKTLPNATVFNVENKETLERTIEALRAQ